VSWGCWSSRLYASANPVTIGRSPNGSFVGNVLIDEVRIWGSARSADQIEAYRQDLVPPSSTQLAGVLPV